MTSRYLVLLLLPLTTLFYGCASIVSGQDQIVSVATPNCPDADCKLVNDDGTYYVSTPGTVTVNREYDDMTVSCKKEGYEPVMLSVSSSTKGMAFGNILLGGIIGGGVDMATGAAYDYPAEIINPLDCRSKAQIAKAPTAGRYDDEALKLVDTDVCESPGFVFRDGNEDIYRSQCLDGTVGVISCGSGTCRPVNVSSPASEDVLDGMPQFSDEVQDIARAKNCSDSFHATDVTRTSETWMVKCATGKFLVIQCKDEGCEDRS
jgi:hypothetical protein